MRGSLINLARQDRVRSGQREGSEFGEQKKGVCNNASKVKNKAESLIQHKAKPCEEER